MPNSVKAYSTPSRPVVSTLRVTKAALFQTPQTLSQALLRKARNVAADGIEPPSIVMIAQRAENMDRPFVCKEIEQHSIIAHRVFAGGHGSGYLKETRLKFGA